MDFGSLLHTAKKNEQQSSKEVRYYSTKFTPPKKEEKKTKNLSANIQKFLARKEEEERKKNGEAKQKREELLALRSQDKKATRRVNVMLKRTKSANQSVIQDAVDNENTAVTLQGPSQPDEDDYGYVSQEASAYYNKMMEKYSKIPDEPKFLSAKKKASSNLASTKDRVRAALEREKEEAMMPHKRKRKHKNEDGEGEEKAVVDEDNDGPDEVEEKKEQPIQKVKKKVNAPPPMNFSELLKLAAQKQHEPIMIEIKPKEDEGPLLTKKQKKEIEIERQRREAKANAQNSRPPPPGLQSSNRIPKLNSASAEDRTKAPRPEINNRIPKPNEPQASRPSNSNNSRNCFKPPSKPERSLDKSSDGRNGNKNLERNSLDKRPPSRAPERRDDFVKPANPESSSNKSYSLPSQYQQTVKPTIDSKRLPKSEGNFKDNRPKVPPTNNNRTRDYPSSKDSTVPRNVVSNGSQPKRLPQNDPQSKRFPPSNVQAKRYPPNGSQQKSSASNDSQPKRFLPSGLQLKRFPQNDMQAKRFPAKDLPPKQFPPPDVRRRDVKPKPAIGNKRRILDDDDEEYDSEMDDFIDDGPEETEDYSKYIKDIFGYDKSRYRQEDDEVDNMESSYSQLMKEEFISTKLGIMEDLEDMKKEEEEKRRKALMKKKRRV